MSVASTANSAASSSYVYQPTSSLDQKSVAATGSTEAQDRFLKLLVAQLNNQDPMNPMDNAEMTSQIAQINTVTGIQQLNTTVKSMAEQFGAMQMLQSSSLVGREVLTEGNAMTRVDNSASGVFELADAATSVKVEVVTPGGVVLDTLQLGALGSGSHGFSWDASQYTNSDLRFKVTATNNGDAVGSTTYMRDKVLLVGMEGGALSLELQANGPVAYNKIKAVL